MYRTPTARRLAKKHATTTALLALSSSPKKTTIANPVKVTPQRRLDPCQKEQLRAQLLENQQRFLSYMASIVEERDALREENVTLREKQRHQAVNEKRIIALAKQKLGESGLEEEEEVLETPETAAGVSRQTPAAFKPKKSECITDFIVGDAANGFRCGLCLKQHGDAKCYWSMNSCYYHIRNVHKVQPKVNMPLPKVQYDPKKRDSKQFFDQVGQSDEGRCKVCAAAGREVVVKGGCTSIHLRTTHTPMRKKKK